MKKIFCFMLCLMIFASVACAESMSTYLNIIEKHINNRARVVPSDNMDYNAELLFNFQDGSLLLCEKNGDCYAWENVNDNAMYSVCEEILQNYSSYGDKLCVNVLRKGENSTYGITSEEDAQNYLDILNLAKQDK